ncbi:MAG: hypothetical protein RLO08_07990 [Parvibaculaceae bacterium]
MPSESQAGRDTSAASASLNVPIKIRHADWTKDWHRHPGWFWVPFCIARLVFFLVVLLPAMLLFLVLPRYIWDRMRGVDRHWSIDIAEKYLRSIVNTDDDIQLYCLMDDFVCVFLYRQHPDPFLEKVRRRCVKNLETSGWDGPDGCVDRDGLRAILTDVQARQKYLAEEEERA